MVVQGDERVVVTCNPSQSTLFGPLVLRDQVRWMLTARKKAQLQVQYCAPAEVSPMNLEFRVDALIADSLYTHQEISQNSVEQACQWMEEQFVVQGPPEGDWLALSRFNNTAAQGHFQLLGNGWRADIERTAEGALLVKRIARHVRRSDSFSLLVGNFAFCDSSVAAMLNNPSQQAALSAMLRDSAGYLELWNLYNDKEWQRALQEAQTLKALRFIRSEGFQNGRENAWRLWPKCQEAYRLFCERYKGLELARDAQFDLGETPPDWSEELSNEEPIASFSATPRGRVRFESDSLVFTPVSDHNDVKPRHPEGWLYLSVAGNRTVGKRRLAAKQSIDSGRRLPSLKWLLEGLAMPAERRRTLKSLTPYAKETFKGGKPTDKQIEALDKALNTPDLAIIIGPPGTGKTQVIAALQRRLAEEAREQNIAGQVLISSFQHDAVDNALERSDVFKLPATRIGGKRRNDEEDNRIDPWLERQVDHVQGKIAEEYERHPELEPIRRLSQALVMTRISSFSPSERAEAFRDMLVTARSLEQHGLFLPASLEQALQDYIAEFNPLTAGRGADAIDTGTVRRIRALRVEPGAFGDDGSDRAWDLLSWLKRHDVTLSDAVRGLLEEASDCRQASDDLLQRLAEGRNTLLDRFLPDYRPAQLKYQLDTQGIRLIDQLERHLHDKVTQRKLGVAWVLEQLAGSLEMDRAAAMAAAQEYSMVVGATCQQAAGRQMASLKAVADMDSMDIEFDTVIVDEAARANPLDLFVPMAMAKRRIVLVGDDRQLPHMLEPEVESQLQEEHALTALQLEAFRSSLFERMRLMLLDLEKKDGIRRVVMLDTQFRMHPVLGDFVSAQFYEAEGFEKVNTTRTPDEFEFESGFIQALQNEGQHYENKVCQWIDVPASAGLAKRGGGTSPFREAEAERVVEEVKRLMVAGGEALSVGVITFYAAQRDLIMEKLTQVEIDGVPLMERKSGGIEPHERFKWARKVRRDGSVVHEERLRVGSVDAFQGKEFDVVLLSCVRTGPSDNRGPAGRAEDSQGKTRETLLNERYGFLRLPNRMNVAMSRQRQMLICVGDAALATHADAQEAVPSLAALHQLCGGAYGSLR
ncbi:DEAD/DEAH box helicase [Pseudomonas sp. GM55]|uniref:DEAD/DEAH box helicase n=1 Tax=Pseudomonas sp. GM55 TaxID=1144333 RepID=UPI00027087CE|nr:AAA domain-containing protein [Pseudomonas sp. GM55]EJM69374.1 hypothetical protein PMI31_04717 [Pseudomonas sp. GM55]